MNSMMKAARNDPIERMLERTSFVLAVFAGLCLLFMMALIAVSVIMRYVVGQPLLGINEIVQLTAVGMVMTSLPFCTFHNGHVTVDIFDNKIGAWGRMIGDIVSRVLSIVALSVLCWRALLRVFDSFEFGDTTNMLGLSLWPFYALLAAGIGLCVVIFAWQIAIIISNGPQDNVEDFT